jgi:ATP-dependent DNA ligase
MPLARFGKQPDRIFEPKLDGFRAVAYIEDGACPLVSRNRNAFRTFETLAQAIGEQLAGRNVILDGEIVRPGPGWPPHVLRAHAPARAVLLLRVRSGVAGWQRPVNR